VAWYRHVPGFRSGKRWKQIAAVLGYLWLIGLLFGFDVYSEPAGAILTIAILASIFLGLNAFGLRGRLFQGDKRRTLAGWSVLVVVGLIALVKLPAPSKPQPASQSAPAVQSPSGSQANQSSPALVSAAASSNASASPAPTVIQATVTPDPTEEAQAKAAIDHLGAANAFVQAKNWPAAFKEYDAAAALDASNRDMQSGRTNAIASATAEAVAATSKQITDHLGAAGSFVQARNYPAALKEYNAVLALNPQNQAAKDGKESVLAPVRDYAAKASGPLSSYSQSMQALSDQSLLVGNNPLLLYSADWKLKIVANLAIMETSADRLANLSAPPAVSDLQAIFRQMRDETYAMAADYAAGIDNLDARRLQSAVTHVKSITADLNQGLAELNQVKQES